jgi:hypothetical protein
MRFRIIASLAIGVFLLGLLPWNLVQPPAAGVFALLSGSISLNDLLTCAGLAFIAGFLSSVISTPYGLQIGQVSAPAGLVVWGLRSAPLSQLFQAAPAAGERIKVYSSLKFEGFIWLAIVLCGFLGAFAADKIFRKKPLELPDKEKPAFQLPQLAQIALSLIGTVFAANFLINILAVDISYSDQQFAHVTAQPPNLQIAFAVFIAFGACGFAAKAFLGSGVFWPPLASAVLILSSASIYGKSNILTHLSSSWPANFFIRSDAAVLPIQIVGFGCLGAVWGYWLAVDWHLWRTYQS